MLWWVLPGALLIGAAAWGTAQWLLQGLPHLPIPQQVSTRIEAVRTALAAAAGVGAGVTLLLAVRRQRHQEVATWHTTHDASERRVTELYTKAVEQLGHDKAPVRLGGLYALERLGQDTPALRQTIVNVICAYLRMPYEHPPDRQIQQNEPGVPRTVIGGVAKLSNSPRHDPLEEFQVRLTAQRILTDHLRHQTSAAPSRWWPRPLDRSSRHWADIHLDLIGATLSDLDLRACRIRSARFDLATFHGTAVCNDAIFDRDAWFGGTTFNGGATFDGVIFNGRVGFNGGTFDGVASFSGATFNGGTEFVGVTFDGNAEFSGAMFIGGASFHDATFSADVTFDGAGAGLKTARLAGARLAPMAAGMVRVLPFHWHIEADADGWQTLRLATPAELTQDGGEENLPANG
ncbi:pentapeptide repeat-containing protein [Nonomuraea endophytica]|uniref:Pentapeptide repeat-containing protein n=1 Tax=Nonomuraea endophytica TaxID=714136 RepID=A0A7W8AA54_9ACTN|nr:pentapeptide repeat-containing protein [Nonomuraea endophytica]MBB5081411.1 hypothetical protein [Nonomuraea endophytica]